MSESTRANLPLPAPPLADLPWRHARARSTLRRLRRRAGRNPQWGLAVVAAAAWTVLAASPHAHAGHGGAHGGGGSDPLALAVMVVAMMLPLVLEPVRAAARATPWRRRNHTSAGFVAGFLGVWMLAMAAIDAAWRLAASRTGWTAAAVVVAGGAGLWELAWRSRAPGARAARFPRERRADANPALRGANAACGCVASCWALMAACVAFAHTLPVMLALFGVQWIGRHRPSTHPALTALAVLGVCAASLAGRMAVHLPR